eukprot:gnl/Chilomastix_cuspidata/4053.p1 GENE.gnl/Chilomastix_cuspidata/4053~~gnl/Chilomastix_cuspidata/4053.p1  ORF type:complete len:638 (-),score=283.31 gnl/Chilomastix_cuspidata/4053:122-2035(-)
MPGWPDGSLRAARPGPARWRRAAIAGGGQRAMGAAAGAAGWKAQTQAPFGSDPKTMPNRFLAFVRQTCYFLLALLVQRDVLMLLGVWTFLGAVEAGSYVNIFDLFMVSDFLIFFVAFVCLLICLKNRLSNSRLTIFPSLQIPLVLVLTAIHQGCAAAAYVMAACWDGEYRFVLPLVALAPLWAGPFFNQLLCAPVLRRRVQWSKFALYALLLATTPLFFIVFTEKAVEDSAADARFRNIFQIIAPVFVGEPCAQLAALLFQRAYMRYDAGANARALAGAGRFLAKAPRTRSLPCAADWALSQNIPTVILPACVLAELPEVRNVRAHVTGYLPPVCDVAAGSFRQLAAAQSTQAWSDRFMVEGIVGLCAHVALRYWPFAALSKYSMDAVRDDVADGLGLAPSEVTFRGHFSPLGFLFELMRRGGAAPAFSPDVAAQFGLYSGALPGILRKLFGFYQLDDAPFRPDAPIGTFFVFFIVVSLFVMPVQFLAPPGLFRQRLSTAAQRPHRGVAWSPHPVAAVVFLFLQALVTAAFAGHTSAFAVCGLLAVLFLPGCVIMTVLDVQRLRKVWALAPVFRREPPFPPLSLSMHARLLRDDVLRAVELVPRDTYVDVRASATDSASTRTAWTDDDAFTSADFDL